MEIETVAIDGKELTIMKDMLRGVAVTETGRLCPFASLDIQKGQVGNMDGRKEKVVAVIPAHGYYVYIGNGSPAGLMVDGKLHDLRTGKPTTMLDLIRSSNGRGKRGRKRKQER